MASYCDHLGIFTVADWTAFERTHPDMDHWIDLGPEPPDEDDDPDDDPHTIVI